MEENDSGKELLEEVPKTGQDLPRVVVILGAIHKLRHTLRAGRGRRSVTLCDKGGKGS